MIIEEALQRYSHLGREHIALAGGDLVPSALQRSILFVLAPWSAPALVALREVTRVLAADPEAPLPLTVVDSDSIAAPLRTHLGLLPHGEGETFWLREGRVVAHVPRWSRGVRWDEVIGQNNSLLKAR